MRELAKIEACPLEGLFFCDCFRGVMKDSKEIRPIVWENRILKLLDQTRLPIERVTVDITNYRDAVVAIRDMQVRGAPAIGVTAAYAVAMAAEEILASENDGFIKALEVACKEIALARPTAVNLEWAVQRMLALATSRSDSPDIIKELFLEAEEIHKDDELINRKMGAFGQELLADRNAVLTHCNAGALATAAFGTAVGVIRESWERGHRFQVFNTETRPFLQGARLTAWEFQEMGIPSTLIIDSAAGMLMNKGRIDCVITGADRIAANGDTANKIGTYSLAVLAKENGIPFYIAAPTSTVDLGLSSGDEINIEERPPEEVTHFRGERTAPEGVTAANPAFDVTPNLYISAIVTENGICRPPFMTSLKSSVEQG